MSIPAKTISALIAGAVLLGGTAAAMAAPAYSSGYVKVRNLPGGYTVDHLHAGEKVNVTSCGPSYCYIKHPGPDGYVKASELNFVFVDYPYPYPAPGPWTGPFPWGGSFCVSGSGGSVCLSGY